jgi:hypothetical protein
MAWSGTAKEIAEKLLKFYDEDHYLALSIWSIDDIDDTEILSNASKEEVLDSFAQNEDCEHGLNWNALQYWIDDVTHKERGGARCQ